MTPSAPGPRVTIAAAIVIAFVGLFYLTTLRQGHNWGDDFALYILHAGKLASFDGYAPTPFIYNPIYPRITWAEPPGFPLLLAPVVGIYGLNLQAMQVEIVAFFLLALAALFIAAKRELRPVSAVGLLGVVGLNPTFWSVKENILPDFLYLACCYACLHLTHRVYRGGLRERREWLSGVLVGAAAYAAYATRTVGAALLVAAVVYDWCRFRKPTRFQIAAIAVFAAGAALQTLVVGSFVNYDVGGLLVLTQMTAKLTTYHEWFRNLWSAGPTPHGPMLFNVTAALAIAGFAVRARQLSIFECFVAIHVLVVLAFAPELRQMFPVIPFLPFYAFAALDRLPAARVRWGAAAASLALSAGILGSYAEGYSRLLPPVPQPDGVHLTTSRQLFDFVASTPPDSVIIFREPRALSLFTGRAASVYDVFQRGQDLGAYMREIRATHLIASTLFSDDIAVLGPFIAAHRERLRLVFDNGAFAVYEVRSS